MNVTLENGRVKVALTPAQARAELTRIARNDRELDKAMRAAAHEVGAVIEDLANGVYRVYHPALKHGHDPLKGVQHYSELTDAAQAVGKLSQAMQMWDKRLDGMSVAVDAYMVFHTDKKVRVVYGETGYWPSARADVLPVEVSEAALAASVFGWRCPGAAPAIVWMIHEWTSTHG